MDIVFYVFLMLFGGPLEFHWIATYCEWQLSLLLSNLEAVENPSSEGRHLEESNPVG